MKSFANILIPLCGFFALSGIITSSIALLLGAVIALIFGNPHADKTKSAASWLIAIAIVGLGAGIPIDDVLKVGAHGIVYTLAGMAFAYVAGLFLGRFLSVPQDISLLIVSGTAICGGSAIAAISKVINARSEAVAVSLGTVFLLNAAALIIFPVLGHMFDLTQIQFGLWAGLAIHDTSSVIGAALQYGPEATQVATTTKLARAMWIFPLAFLIGLIWEKGESKIPLKSILQRCWFIAGFLMMALLTSYVPLFQSAAPYIEQIAKRLMVLVLFLIGLGMTKELLKQVGFKPFLQGVVLWVVVSSATLLAIMAGWIVL